MPEETPTPKDWEKIQEAAETASEGTDAELLAHPSYKALQEQITTLEQALFDEKEKALRALADADNSRRRTQRELENTQKYSLEKLIRELLPIMDGLEHAVLACQQSQITQQNLLEGVELTLKMFLDTLQKFSVVVLDPQGQPFDPNHHEAMSTQETQEFPPNTCVMVLQKGYRLHDRVIRPARVIVSKQAST